MGDTIYQGDDSTLINRSTVTDSFNQNNTDTKQAIIAYSNEVERLLKQLHGTNPSATEAEQATYVDVAINPTIKQRAIAALKEGTDTAIDEFVLENKYLKVVKAVAKGWLQPKD